MESFIARLLDKLFGSQMKKNSFPLVAFIEPKQVSYHTRVIVDPFSTDVAFYGNFSDYRKMVSTSCLQITQTQKYSRTELIHELNYSF